MYIKRVHIQDVQEALDHADPTSNLVTNRLDSKAQGVNVTLRVQDSKGTCAIAKSINHVRQQRI